MAESNSMSSAANSGAREGWQSRGGREGARQGPRQKAINYQVHQLQQIEVAMDVELMFQRDVFTSREFSYHRLMLVHSMMSGCSGLFRQTSIII